MDFSREGTGNFYVKDDLLSSGHGTEGRTNLCAHKSPRINLSFSTICHITNVQKRIQQNFLWPEMNKTIQEYMDSCLQCQQKARVFVKDRIPISVVPRDQCVIAYYRYFHLLLFAVT